MSDLAAPTPTPETLPYWTAAADGELHLPRCNACGEFHFYPRGSCPHCHSTDLEWQQVSGEGTLYSYVINHRPPKAFRDRGPIVIAVVQLDEGPRMLTNIIGVDPEPERLQLDMRLTVDFEPRGDYALPVFRPATTSEEES